MVRTNIAGLALGLACIFAMKANAQGPTAVGLPRESNESLTSWEWFEELHLPEAKQDRYFDLLLTPSVFDKSRADLGDLRLYDRRGRVIPYALRILQAENKQEALPAREFNRTKHPDRSVEVSLDLGDNPIEHNEIDVATSGTNFRRRVQVEGSDTNQSWGSILDKAYLVHFQVDSQRVDVHRLHYAASRFRYVRVRVFPESGNDEDRPDIAQVTVYHSTRLPGEYVTLPATLTPRQAEPAGGGPGSAWFIEFGAQSVPCEQLSFDVADNDFVRSYRLEKADPDETMGILATGEWRRRAGAELKPMEIHFNEVRARRLRLVVIDFRNPPLSLTAVRYTAPARQIIFARVEDLAPPLRLYFGNPNAEPPRYDFAENLPAALEPRPARAALHGLMQNPIYQPVPKPWTERWPWLVYVVLSVASLVLLAILLVLSRGAIARHDAAEQMARSR
jgi:hypothetical protein